MLASVKDVAAATAWVAKEAGGTASTATYGDGTITTVDHDGMTLAWATRVASMTNSRSFFAMRVRCQSAGSLCQTSSAGSGELTPSHRG